jgi:hypothetical protein
MQDHELKKLLMETCPIRPGQESRAWAALRRELFEPEQNRSVWSWLYYPTWRGAVVGAFALMVAFVLGNIYFNANPRSLATANSQSPGIYATAFYSRSADAQVVWLNGLEPASDKPTYLDPTTEVKVSPETPAGSVGDPNSL